MLHRLLAAAAALAVLLTGGLTLSATPADAAWRLTSPPASAKAAATTINATPMPTITSINVLGGVYVRYTLTWPSVGLTNGMPVTGYQVTKTMVGGNGGNLLAGGTCAGSVSLLGLGAAKAVVHAATTNQTCYEEMLISAGKPQYQITPVFGAYWRGAASSWALAP